MTTGGTVVFDNWKLRGNEGDTCFMIVGLHTDVSDRMFVEPTYCEIGLTKCDDGYHTERDGAGFQYCEKGAVGSTLLRHLVLTVKCRR